MRPILITCFAPLTLLALAACQAPLPPTGPTAMTLRIPDYDRFVDETLTLLRERDYRPERVDRERGIIVAGPTTSSQWFEFWRRDIPSGYESLESSLHTIRRTVNIDVEWLGDATPDAQTGGTVVTPRPSTSGAADSRDDLYRVTVQVDKARYNTVSRQVTTASGALAIYNENLPTEQGLRRATAADSVWVPMGRDGVMEGMLLARIAEGTQAVEDSE